MSALIEESPEQAGRFVDELSKIYRYLLHTNRSDQYRTGMPGTDQELIPLRAEIAFIESYVHLLQTRYGAGVTVRLAVCDDWLDSSLPPLTLQLLTVGRCRRKCGKA